MNFLIIKINATPAKADHQKEVFIENYKKLMLIEEIILF